jgi:omega-6 fatty acid desaturase (delta-12 desaturase)
LRYRIYRHPLVLFGIGPAYLFLLRHRLPVGMMRGGWRPWTSALGTNAGIAVSGLLIWAHGREAVPADLSSDHPGRRLARRVVLLRPAPVRECPLGSQGRAGPSTKRRCTAARYYVLPGVIRWFSANIGMHHVHHLASRIPFYRLPEALRDIPVLSRISRLTLRESFRTVRLALWDERTRRLISFREARAI